MAGPPGQHVVGEGHISAVHGQPGVDVRVPGYNRWGLMDENGQDRQ